MNMGAFTPGSALITVIIIALAPFVARAQERAGGFFSPPLPPAAVILVYSSKSFSSRSVSFLKRRPM